ncbi:hypothetical protein Tco_0858931 [Tanacetum coccineum]|uniref:Uncharacterized protein n=1 Tax=Tanacetum coccineum TaxID=301880 RepID=A0ABQ5BG82_9ASTR
MALVLTNADLDPLNNSGISVQNLAGIFNVEPSVLLRAMTSINYFVWNSRRAHGEEGRHINFFVRLPPPRGPVFRTYNDADTWMQFMGVLANDVDHQGFQVSYTRGTRETHYIYNDRDWHEAMTYFHLLFQAGRLSTPTLTVSLVGMPVPIFQFVAGHGNPAPGAPRSQGRRGAIAGRGALPALQGPGPVGHGRGFVEAFPIQGPPGRREIVLGVEAVGRARAGRGVDGLGRREIVLGVEAVGRARAGHGRARA